jgi:hypothetical protein
MRNKKVANLVLFGKNSRGWTRVASWCIFTPKIPIWVYFGEPWNEKGWYIVRPFGIYCSYFTYYVNGTAICGHLVHCFPALVYCIKKNMATLRGSQFSLQSSWLRFPGMKKLDDWETKKSSDAEFKLEVIPEYFCPTLDSHTQKKLEIGRKTQRFLSQTFSQQKSAFFVV